MIQTLTFVITPDDIAATKGLHPEASDDDCAAMCVMAKAFNTLCRDNPPLAKKMLAQLTIVGTMRGLYGSGETLLSDLFGGLHKAAIDQEQKSGSEL